MRYRDRPVNEATSRQLTALARVVDSLHVAAIEYWLFGGWAVDFHAGRVTRDHDDIDVAVWLADRPQIASLLEADGWRHAPEPDEDGGTGYERDSVRLELTYLVRAPDGSAYIPLRERRAPWPSDALPSVAAELGGVRAQVIPLEALARGKSRIREEPCEAAKDRTDAAVLASVTSRRSS
jgi:aminoglycoside-2''-adenylyltransferase